MPAARILFSCILALAGPACTSAEAPNPEWPPGLSPFGEGYPVVGDPCRRLGETDVTRSYLDDSADLVGCPTGASAKKLNGRVVAVIGGITLVSIPSPDRLAEGSGAANKSRGTDVLTKACLTAVANEGTIVDGVDHAVRTGEKVEVYVKVRGAQALWRCVGDRTGRVETVEYTEFEGRL